MGERYGWGVIIALACGCIFGETGSGDGPASTSAPPGSTGAESATSSSSTAVVPTTSESTVADESGGSTGSPSASPVIFVEFDGATLTLGADDDSRTDTTLISEVAGTLDPYGDAARAAEVLAAFEALMAPFGAEITTERPATGDYLMLVATSTEGIASTNTGIVENDCGDSNPNNIGVVFINPDDPFDAEQQACEVARVMAFSLGLEFVDGGDIMSTPSPCSGGASFEDTCHPIELFGDDTAWCAPQHEVHCPPNQQNSHQELLALYSPS